MASAETYDLTKESIEGILNCIPDTPQKAPTKFIIKAVVFGREIGESLKEHAHSLIRRHTHASLLLAAKHLKLKLKNTVEN